MIEEFIKAFVMEANKEGIRKIRFYAEKTEDMLITVFEGQPERTELSNLERIYVEGEWQGKTGSAYTEKLEKDIFEELIEDIRQSAECDTKLWVDKPLKQIIFTEEKEADYLDAKAITAQLLAAEQAAFDEDVRVQAVSECWYERRNRSVMITNGREIMCEHCGEVEQFGMKAAAGEADQVQTCFRICLLDKSKSFIDLSKEIAREAVELLGAKILPTGSYPVILKNCVVSELLSAYLPAFYKENVIAGMSCLCNRLHTKVASEQVSISEEPLMDGTAFRRSFDDEGEPTFSKALINCGRLATYLCNKSNADDKMQAGNGFRMEYKQPVTTGVTNVLFQGGENTEEELLYKMKDGLVITQIDGTFAGAKFSSGDFVLIAKGYQMKEHKKTGAFHRVTIAGDFISMLRSIRAAGKELYIQHQGNQTVTAPSILLEKLTVSGL